jgi:hypothetical protein
MNRDVCEIGLQLKIPALLNPHMRMARPVADRVAAMFDWHLPSIPDEFPLLFEERMFSWSRKKREGSAVSEVLDVCVPGCFSPGPRRFPDAEAILFDELFIDGTGIFSLWDLAGDIEEVPMADIRHGKLLNESGDACRLTAILHRPSTLALQRNRNQGTLVGLRYRTG